MVVENWWFNSPQGKLKSIPPWTLTTIHGMGAAKIFGRNRKLDIMKLQGGYVVDGFLELRRWLTTRIST